MTSVANASDIAQSIEAELPDSILSYDKEVVWVKSELILKCACDDRDNPTIASVTKIWRGADLQEREIWDLMGIKFEGHPNLKRIMLWEGFEGHPLRKDYLG